MAYEFYVTIKGVKQGDFKGESIRAEHAKKIAGLSYSHEITAPRDIASGRASGKRQHGPITFTKEWGASTPMIFQALVNNEVLESVLFEFYNTNDSGEEQIYHKITLSKATVSKIKQVTGTGESAGSAKTSAIHDTHELEEVSLTYEKIEVESVTGATLAMDDWAAANK
jgi:type VI secretion system secreted protein Hcp